RSRAQLRHKRRKLSIRKRRKVFDATNSATCRQEIVEMSAPACRVLALSITARLGPIENAFNATAYAVCGFWFCFPDRLQRRQHECSVNVGNRQIANVRIGVSYKRPNPLLVRPRIAPAGFMRRDVTFRAFSESLASRGFK